MSAYNENEASEWIIWIFHKFNLGGFFCSKAFDSLVEMFIQISVAFILVDHLFSLWDFKESGTNFWPWWRGWKNTANLVFQTMFELQVMTHQYVV